MKPRQEVFDTYWRFAAKRQRIFFERLKGDPPPWTDDPILQEYKFCNVYRVSDRVSQYLIRNVIYSGSQKPDEVAFRTVLFRLFNKIETWEYLINRLGKVELASFDFEIYSGFLSEAKKDGPIFGNTFILCANKAFGYEEKHLNYLALVEQMFKKDRLAWRVEKIKSLKKLFELLRTYPLLGNFMAYQIAIDLNYSEVVNFSENDFTVAGPGAVRGIKKCFVSTGGKDYEHVVKWMVKNQDREFERLGINFQNLWGRALHAIDCQGLFCEVDKYCRIAFPKLKSNRVRIKAKLKPRKDKVEYFYPPKWGINRRVEKYTIYSRGAFEVKSG